MRRLIVFVTAVALVSLGLVVAPAAAKVPGSDGQIVFSRQTGTGGADVFIANPDGTNPHQVPLVYPAEDFGVPIWSPDGTKLLISHLLRFDSAGELLPFRPATVSPDGSDTRLLEPPGAPFDMGCHAWSPDSTRLLCGFGVDPPGIFSIRASDGGDPVRLSTNPFGAQDQAGDFAPDGSRFVFVRYKPGASPQPRPSVTEQAALFVENADGTGLHQLTPYGLTQAHDLASARWSPDGQEIIFATARGQLLLAHPDGSALSPIQLDTGSSRYFAAAPGWSPDGTRIVFSLFIGGQEDIFTAGRDGTGLVQVTNTPDFEPFADWGPRS
jgi:Tol biopolymer transport system component